MGWKASLIIIENRNDHSDEKSILKALGKEEFEFSSETTLEECINPGDNSINIGFFNGNIIIADDYQVTNNSLEKANDLSLTNEEKKLVAEFPNAEIIMVACHSAVNYHGYSLIQNGQKTRLKTIIAGEPAKEFGERTVEEKKIYENSFNVKGNNYWKDETDPETEYAEDEFMEKFTFGFAKRRLGVLLDHSEGDTLLSNTSFKKFIQSNIPPNDKPETGKKKSLKRMPYITIIVLLIIWQILKRTVL